jgi:phage shock protein A
MFDRDLKARRAIDELEERCEKLQRSFHALELEWADTLDKVKRMMQRIAKRAEVVEKAEEGSGQDETADDGRTPLPSRMQQINAAILARRNRGGV